jgi:hypothetical protein
MKSMVKRIMAKKMAEGGEVERSDKKTLGDMIGYPKRMSEGGEVSSIASAIMSRRNPVEEDLEDPTAPLESELDDLNEEAASEVQEGEIDDSMERRNRIAAIRKRNRI